MHGTVLNFDNIVVGTKAWNLLFAVMDWAAAKMKAETLKPPEKGWKDIIRQIIENADDKKLLDAWVWYTLTKMDEGFEEDLAFVACTEYLEAWKTINYGKMSKLLSRLVASNHGNALPKFVRDSYSLYILEQFEIQALNHTAVAVCEIEVPIKLPMKMSDPLRSDGFMRVKRVKSPCCPKATASGSS